jgi:hypothetical protein
MTLEEFRASQKRRVFAVSRNYGIAGLVLGTLLAIQGFFGMLENGIKSMGLGRRRMIPMTLGEFQGSHRRRLYAVARSTSLVGLVLLVLLAISAGMVGKKAVAQDSPAKPAMQQQMQAQMQDMMVMMQNTAVWTQQGLVVLQGNRLLNYATDLQLQQTITLPLPQLPAIAPAATPGNMPPDARPSVRSQLAARILPTTNGLIVIRGRQVIWLDAKFRITGQAMLPELPPLTPAEVAAICPMGPPMIKGEGMLMGGASMPGMPGMPIQSAAAAKAGSTQPQR